MSKLTEEEKRYVLLYVLENQGDNIKTDNEKMWRNLESELGRNWMEIRDEYFKWGTEMSESAALPEAAKLENNIKSEPLESQQVQNDNIIDDELVLVDQIVFGNIDDAELQQVLNNEYVYQDGQQDSYSIADFFQYSNDHNNLQVGEKKRLRDLSVYDVERLKILEKQSKEELEMKRKEHEKKMKFYSQQIKNGSELHHEKMKIYLAKYHAQVDKVHDIDYAICNKITTKRYKSGPI